MLEYVLPKLIKEITGKDASPAFSLGPYPALCYKVTPISDGPLKQSQVEIRIMGKDLDECLEIRKLLIEKMNIIESQPSICVDDVIMRPQVAGGGWLFSGELQMWEYPTIFTITWRCK